MNGLTYRRQMLIGILGIGLAHVLAWITGMERFLNLGWIFFGGLFLIHPVWLENADRYPHIKRYVRLTGAAVILLGMMLRTGGGDTFWYDRIEKNLGVDVSDAVIVTGHDDHSGFHGDGTLYAVLEFPDDSLEQRISAPGGWQALPLTETLQTLVYGDWEADRTTGPFIGITMPEAKRGYWYFYDRQGETSQDSCVLKRNSFNYTIAIYDADADCLYYCEYDT